MSNWTSCDQCKAVLVVAGLIIGVVAGWLAASILGLSVALCALAGALIGAGMALGELGNYLCCEAGAKDCCPKGSTRFWREFGRIIKKTPGQFSADDCKALNAVINTLLMNGQIDDQKAASLRAALGKHCG